MVAPSLASPGGVSMLRPERLPAVLGEPADEARIGTV
jgi:hypothetical protein